MSQIEVSLQGYIIRDLPVVKEGDDLASMIVSRFELLDGDILAIASTIVAKSEGRFRLLDDYKPSDRAIALAGPLGKDPRFVQAVLDESEEILLETPFLLSVTRFGHIGVNAGIDQSNVGEGKILLLPENPGASAERIRDDLRAKHGKDCAVMITDTCGRPFRCGVAGVAIGCAGIGALKDWRGKRDIHGRTLEITLEAVADEVAGMANMLMGEAGDGTPAAVLRGLSYPKKGDALFMPESVDIIRRHLKS
ncbi:MAG TPA: coenzyme F420-0:L-glutamate ligase [Methanotrichaceae archaeon]|nr:coenzyme F420-0:L-glutamate ligase [Methanotrichaceae archaeon]